MKRKYNPKETYENIVNVSAKLFLENGFEKTSMQDIVNSLGMSKGAIFHHFKSKEDIFNAVVNLISENAENIVNGWIEEIKNMNGKDMLRALLKKNLDEKKIHEYDSIFAEQVNNPKFVLFSMQNTVIRSAPIFEEIIIKGNKDGSLNVEYPRECAEVFFLLINFWCDPSIFICELDVLEKRLRFIQFMMKKLGADIVEEDTIKDTVNFIETLKNK